MIKPRPFPPPFVTAAHPARRAVLAAARILLAAVAVLVAAPAAAQSGDDAGGDDVTVILDAAGLPQLRLAFPAAELDRRLAGEYWTAAQEIEQTLRDDLEASGVFQIQGPAELAVLSVTGDRSHDFEQFRSLANQIVLYASVYQEGDKVVVEGRVYDLPSGQSVLGKRYRGQPDQARRVAHYLADAIVLQFTGRPGIALTTIAFHSKRDGYQELYLMDYDGRNQRRITGHKSTSGFPDWSPSGDAIAYVSYFTASPTVFYVDLASGSKVEVYGQGTLNISPSFSPDGTMLAFGHSVDANVDIYVCPRRCQRPRQLTNARGIDTNPVWSPDGEHIAFTSDRSGRPNLYVMDKDGGNVRRISFEGNYNDGATWRPDGSQIAYASRRGNKFQIALTNLVTLETVTLTNGPDSYESPSFSPDGRRIAFTVQRGPETQIYVMNADGSAWMQLTHEGSSSAPDWSGYPR